MKTSRYSEACPSSYKLEQIGGRFDAFRTHYNEERPHEALYQTPPAAHWQPSTRRVPERILEPWYDADHEVRRVRRTGEIKWRGQRVFVGEALSGEPVGLSELDNGNHIVRFCNRDLGVIDRKFRFLRFAPPRARLARRTENETRIVSGMSPV